MATYIEQLAKYPFAQRDAVIRGIILGRTYSALVDVRLCVERPRFLEVDRKRANPRVALAPRRDRHLTLDPVLDVLDQVKVSIAIRACRCSSSRDLGRSPPSERSKLVRGKHPDATTSDDVPQRDLVLRVESEGMLPIAEKFASDETVTSFDYIVGFASKRCCLACRLSFEEASLGNVGRFVGLDDAAGPPDGGR